MTFQEWVQESTVAEGLVRVFKPYGIPSTALVEMYKCISLQKVGHGGTLDPLAQGALLLGIGKGTKLLTKYLESEKLYRTQILLGASSPSGDLELPLEVPLETFKVNQDKIEQILEELSKGFQQELPALSSAKQQGKNFYELVRSGKQPEKRFVNTSLLEWKLHNYIEVTNIKLVEELNKKSEELKQAFNVFAAIGESIGYKKRYPFLHEKWQNSLAASQLAVKSASPKQFVIIDLEIFVPKGTYIRSLATDIASRVGMQGVLLSLERLNAGNR